MSVQELDALGLGSRPRRNLEASPAVYLAGPMAGLGFWAAKSWRDDVESALATAERPLRCLDPMRGRPSLAADAALSDRATDVVKDTKSIVARDLADIRRADFVLFNFADATAASIGSTVELGYARALDKFIVVVLTPTASRDGRPADNPHDHMFVRELASAVVEDLDAAIALLASM